MLAAPPASLQYAFRDRKVKKREMRALWITRITAGSRHYGVSPPLLPFCVWVLN